MFQPPPETLIGQVTAAFAVGLQSGPVRLDFTDRRFIVTSNSSPSLPPALGLYRAWKATLPPGPYCRIVGVPYLQDLQQVWAEVPNPEVSFVRAHRELGLGVDRTESELGFTLFREGIQVGLAAATSSGAPERLPLSNRLLFRVPSPPEALHAFLLQTALAKVVQAP